MHTKHIYSCQNSYLFYICVIRIQDKSIMQNLKKCGKNTIRNIRVIPIKQRVIRNIYFTIFYL